MSNIKLSPDLFLETIELQRFKEFLDLESIDPSTGYAANGGFRKNLLENTTNYGLIKNNKDISFLNGKVSQDINSVQGSVTFKTIKTNPLYAIDKNGQFLYQGQTQSILVPGDGNWYWVRVSHQYTNKEKGTFSLSIDGTLTGTGGEFTKVLRGSQNNFASKISLLNSTLNQNEYEILSVIDDNNCILLGTSFQAETELNLGIIGTFTPSVTVPNPAKLIFQYDSTLLELVLESTNNTPPTTGFVQDSTFYLARIKSDGTNLIVQDKRLNYWETKGSQQTIDIDRNLNPIIGVESVKYQNKLSPGDENTIEISWGLRSSNWSIDTNLNKLSIQGPVIGGIYRDINSIPDNIFNNWRVYTSNGKYSRIISSSISGSAINLILDVLDIDNYFTDGLGNLSSIINQQLLVVPDAENISIKLTPNISDNISSEEKIYNFPINTPVGKCKVLAYSLTTCLYNIKYAYKNLKEYTSYRTIPSNNVVTIPQKNGYYNENQFDSKNNLITSPVLSLYTNSDAAGFIPVNLSPNAYSKFVGKVDKGDLIGVQEITTFGSSLYDLIVGTNLNYLRITGDITLVADQQIRLNTTGAINGNRFKIIIDCNTFDLSTFSFKIVQGSGSSNTELKDIKKGDLYMMKNVEGGITYDCIFDGTNWTFTQNYDLGRPNEVIELYNVDPSALFDLSTKLGIVRGLFGYVISDGTLSSPDLRGKFIVGYSPLDADYSSPGNTGGTEKNTAVPAHTHHIPVSTNSSGPQVRIATTNSSGEDDTTFSTLSTGTGSDGVENRPPYFTLLLAYKLF